MELHVRMRSPTTRIAREHFFLLVGRQESHYVRAGSGAQVLLQVVALHVGEDHHAACVLDRHSRLRSTDSLHSETGDLAVLRRFLADARRLSALGAREHWVQGDWGVLHREHFLCWAHI